MYQKETIHTELNYVDEKKALLETNNIKELIETFKNIFILKFGLEPFVVFNKVGSRKARMNIKDIVDTTDELLKTYYPKRYKKGIRSRSHEHDLTNIRYAYFKIASDMGYGPLQIGDAIGFNHSTVTYGIKRYNELLSMNDKQTEEIVSELRYALYLKMKTSVLELVDIKNKGQVEVTVKRLNGLA